MKKSLIVLAALGAFTGVASAQSSVTLFGVVDLSVNSIKYGNTTRKSMDSNMLNSNRLGFRGTEDLGGGMTASFWLEGAMANDTGASALDFQRRSTVSLSGSFGEIRLGRDYTNTFSTIATFDAYGANGMGSPINLYLSNFNPAAGLGAGVTTTVRANNMVGYFLPANLGGFYGSVQVAAGENVKGNKYTGARLGYAAGPFDVAVSMARTDSDYKNANFGASFNFGVAKVMGFWDQRKYGALKHTTTAISTSVPLGQGEFRASYAKGNAAGGATSANDTSLFGVEYIYNLSKRTALYGQYARLSNDGLSSASFAGIGPTPVAAGADGTGYGVGIRHSF